MPSKSRKSKNSRRMKRPKKATRAQLWLSRVRPFLIGRSLRIPAVGLSIGLGVLILSASLWYHQHQRTVLTFEGLEQTQVVSLPEFSGNPLEITIPSQDIDLSIETSQIDNGIWQIADDGASHLASSAVPGQGSNIVIYGHNQRHLFGKLANVVEGEMISLKADNGRTYDYRVDQIQVVDPDDIQWVLPTDHERLTVYTCTGFLDSQRLVLTAVPVRVSS